MAFFKDKFSALKRDFIVIFKIILSGLTAGFLMFFISALSGTDLKKNTEMIKELEVMYAEINTELETGESTNDLRHWVRFRKSTHTGNFFAV